MIEAQELLSQSVENTAFKSISLASKPLAKIIDLQNLKGDLSEIRVVEALGEIPIVESVQRTSPNSLEDRQWIDLFVYLDSTDISLPEEPIKAQVKSSHRYEKVFQANVAKAQGILISEVDDWLAQNRYVVLNGQKSTEEIICEFGKQMTRITELRGKSEIRT